MESRSVRMRRYLPWVWPALVVLGLVALIFSNIEEAESDPLSTAFGVLVVLSFGFLGGVILWRDSRNTVGWLMQIAGTAMLISIAIEPILQEAPVSPTFVDYLAIVASIQVGLNLLIFPLFLIGFIFPDGRFLTRWWSWPAWLGAIFVPATLLLSVFTEEIGPAFGEWTIANPVGFVPPAVLEVVFGLWVTVVYLMAPSALTALVVRYRRSEREVRAQIRWVLFGSIGFFLTFVLLVLEPLDSGGPISALAGLGFATIPISITIAITKYRLYDIDRLISRTIGYALVLVVLGAVYLLGAVWLPTQLLDEQPPVFVAGSTLAVVALFSPLRKRVLGWVDRRFYRSRYRAEKVLASFSDRVRDEVAMDDLAAQWESAVVETLQPSAIGVWVQGRSE